MTNYAAMSDPARNPQFRRRWAEPLHYEEFRSIGEVAAEIVADLKFRRHVEHLHGLGARAIGELKCMIDRVEEAGVKTELHLVNEHPVAAILKLADELEADLIAMGTRGLSGAKHLLLGSATERVVRLSRCPVLTAKANTD